MSKKLCQTDKPYYLILGDRHLYHKAALMYISASLYRKTELDESFIKEAAENGKSILWLRYDTSSDNTKCVTEQKRIADSESWILSYNIYGNELPDGTRILSPERAADALPEIIARNERFMVDHGIVRADYRDRCGNCHKTITIGDRYCRFCGAKRGEDKFQPEDNNFYCVYGPPILTKFRCDDCGLSWKVTVLGGCRKTYCPNCGKSASAITEIEKSFFDLT